MLHTILADQKNVVQQFIQKQFGGNVKLTATNGRTMNVTSKTLKFYDRANTQNSSSFSHLNSFRSITVGSSIAIR